MSRRQRPPRRSPEQITMGPRALEKNMGAILCQGIDQNPVRLDMAVAAAHEVPAQRMIFVMRRQRFAFNQEVEYDREFGQLLSTPLGALHVFLELAGAAEGSHRPKSA